MIAKVINRAGKSTRLYSVLSLLTQVTAAFFSTFLSRLSTSLLQSNFSSVSIMLIYKNFTVLTAGLLVPRPQYSMKIYSRVKRVIIKFLNDHFFTTKENEI